MRLARGEAGKAPWGEWNNATLVQGGAEAELEKIKRGAGGPMLIFASADLVRSISGAGLIDEYRILMHPVVLGAGKPFFAWVGQRLRCA